MLVQSILRDRFILRDQVYFRDQHFNRFESRDLWLDCSHLPVAPAPPFRDGAPIIHTRQNHSASVMAVAVNWMRFIGEQCLIPRSAKRMVVTIRMALLLLGSPGLSHLREDRCGHEKTAFAG